MICPLPFTPGHEIAGVVHKSSRLRCRSPTRIWHKALGLERAVAAQIFEVVIHMPQRQITGDGGLRDHEIGQRNGDPPPSHDISQAGCRFPDPIRDGNLRQGTQGFEELGNPVRPKN